MDLSTSPSSISSSSPSSTSSSVSAALAALERAARSRTVLARADSFLAGADDRPRPPEAGPPPVASPSRAGSAARLPASTAPQSGSCAGSAAGAVEAWRVRAKRLVTRAAARDSDFGVCAPGTTCTPAVSPTDEGRVLRTRRERAAGARGAGTGGAPRSRVSRRYHPQAAPQAAHAPAAAAAPKVLGSVTEETGPNAWLGAAATPPASPTCDDDWLRSSSSRSWSIDATRGMPLLPSPRMRPPCARNVLRRGIERP